MDSIKTQINKEQLEKVAHVLKSIAHPIRISIVELLTENEEISVNKLCEILNCEQSLTSHHLTNMRLKGIVKSRREGQNIYYSLKLREVTKVIDCMRSCDIDNL